MSHEEEFFTPLDLAIHATVKEYVDPRTGIRGAVALANKVGSASSTISNKANPTIAEARVGLTESITWQLVSDDFRILQAYAAALGHCAYRLPIAPLGSDLEILDAYLAVHEAAGRKANAIAAALRDGRITRDELRAIRAIFDDQVRAGLQLIACLERLQ